MDIFKEGINVLALSMAALIAVAIAVGIVVGLQDFFRDLKYIKMEIKRSSGGEREYWKKRKKLLWRYFFSYFNK